jgi:hypothetical protein
MATFYFKTVYEMNVGVSKSTIRTYAKSGRLRVGRLGRRVIVPMKSLEKFVRDATRS